MPRLQYRSGGRPPITSNVTHETTAFLLAGRRPGADGAGLAGLQPRHRTDALPADADASPRPDTTCLTPPADLRPILSVRAGKRRSPQRPDLLPGGTPSMPDESEKPDLQKAQKFFQYGNDAAIKSNFDYDIAMYRQC